ncbi:hypothetical protein CCP3SC1_740004 [Gammaproteobacteria bacterium]
MSNQPFVYHKIVAGVRMRTGIHPAMLRAIGLARTCKGEVAVVHAMEKSEITAPALEVARRHFDELRVTYPEVTSTCLKTGSIWNAMLETARGTEAGLIAISTHTHSQLSALLNTSSSDHLLHHADRDVLVTRTERYNANQVPENYRNILLITDLQDNHRHIAERAIAIATNQGAHLSLLHVVDRYPVDRENEDIAHEDQDPIIHQKRIRCERLGKFAQEFGLPHTSCEVVVTSDAAHNIMPSYAQTKGADLIVIGAHKPTTLDLLLGSIADKVVHYSPCDVLVVHIGPYANA